MQKYYVESYGGRCIIIEAKSLEAAIKIVKEELGSINGPFSGRLATAEDIAWYEAMR